MLRQIARCFEFAYGIHIGWKIPVGTQVLCGGGLESSPPYAACSTTPPCSGRYLSRKFDSQGGRRGGWFNGESVPLRPLEKVRLSKLETVEDQIGISPTTVSDSIGSMYARSLVDIIRTDVTFYRMAEVYACTP